VQNGQLMLGVTFSAGQSGSSVWGIVTDPGGRSLGTASSDSASGISGLYPMASLKWQQSDHNAMVYVIGSAPTGPYDPNRPEGWNAYLTLSVGTAPRKPVN
jgi:hypothetical protein